ncbi:MAG: galactose mutarotase [Steroidobacteraceae bacterium]|nr:galactose mutarotase [Steroidobacteraceae bacterium]
MRNHFGILEDGRAVESLTLGTADGLQVEVLTYGAILRRLSFPVGGARRDFILSFATLAEYERDRAYVGPLVGRFGNRIANSRFSIDGREHQVFANEGVNHLHGGMLGFGKRLWHVVNGDTPHLLGNGEYPHLRLAYRSPAGEEGYPGNLDVEVHFEIRGHSLAITLSAVTDAPTPVNLTYHPYFNINGAASAPATQQRLRIPASRYLPVRPGLIPTGETAPVEGTTFDFRKSRPLAPPAIETHPQLREAGGYDHCWLLDADADCACELTSANGDATLTLLGSGPGLQFYNGQFLSKTHPAIGSGVILEPQGLPNAPNEPRFPNAILRPGENYRATIEYRARAN